VCLKYEEPVSGNEDDIKLLHGDNGQWVDVTTSLDKVNNIVCGEVDHFSPFAVAVKEKDSVDPHSNEQCTPVLTPVGNSFTLFIPALNFTGSDGSKAVYWADFETVPTTDGSLRFKAANYGEVTEPGKFSNCSLPEMSAEFNLTMPYVEFNSADGDVYYWADLEYIEGTDPIQFNVTGFGEYCEATLAATDTGFDFHISALSQTAADGTETLYWADLKTVPATDGSLRFEAVDYGAIDNPADYSACRAATLSPEMTIYAPFIKLDSGTETTYYRANLDFIADSNPLQFNVTEYWGF